MNRQPLKKVSRSDKTRSLIQKIGKDYFARFLKYCGGLDHGGNRFPKDLSRYRKSMERRGKGLG